AEPFLGALLRPERPVHVDFLRQLRRFGENDHLVPAHLHEPAVDGDQIFAAFRPPGADGGHLQRRHERDVARQNAELARRALHEDARHVLLVHFAFGGDDFQPQAAHRFSSLPAPDQSVLAFSTASSMTPTLWKAGSGRSSCLPSRISLKLRTVSLTGTYLPGRPVNGSATCSGWDKNSWMRRARWTISLSSSDSSSMPRMAMMSSSSL